MENTQTFNTQNGIKKVLKDLKLFLKNYQAKNQTKVTKHRAIHFYQQMYSDSLLFPPCNIVNSLLNDITQYKVNNIKADIDVIADNQDKLIY